MNIDYVGRNYQLDERVRDFTEDKLKKVTKFLEEPIEARITLEVEKHRHVAELHVAHRHGVLQATEETPDMYDAINLAIDKVEKQARRARKKFMDTRRRAQRSTVNGSQWPVDVVEAASLRGGGGPKIVKSSQLQIKPMTIEEAALQLEDSKNEFVVFRDSTSDKVAVLYRRRDSNYGLIAPEF